ncbi:MAG: hypothetical protein KC425_12455 [Anaerolineales bacterium]|nr:hypothetical protein [Anaerolineales bacterium]
MLKRLAILLLEFLARLAGHLLAGYIQQDAWQNLYTPPQLLGAMAGPLEKLNRRQDPEPV